MTASTYAPVEVPFVDLAWQHTRIAREVAEGFARVIGACAFVDGPEVAAFEREFAAFCEIEQCVAVANGTDALELLLRSVRLPEGSEVLLPANTFVATAEAVVRAGLRPALVDCDDAYLVRPDSVAARVTAETSAVIAVHLYGQLADMEGLEQALRGTSVALFEDAAQAHGARRWGAGIGRVSRGAATSFYPGKNLGAYGDGGAVVTRDADRADLLRRLRNHGSTVKYVHDEVGFNSRLDALQAVVLRAKLRQLVEWNAARRRAAELYTELLAGVDGVQTPSVLAGNEHVWHLYVVQVERREKVVADLRRCGISAGVHYPVPIHLQPAFAHLGYAPGDFPVSERLSRAVLSLPMYPGITEDQVRAVAGAVARSATT